jgi:hypothetical protein
MQLIHHHARRPVYLGAALLALAALSVRSSAQSLDPKKPAPMKAGSNAGTCR